MASQAIQKTLKSSTFVLDVKKLRGPVSLKGLPKGFFDRYKCTLTFKTSSEFSADGVDISVNIPSAFKGCNAIDVDLSDFQKALSFLSGATPARPDNGDLRDPVGVSIFKYLEEHCEWSLCPDTVHEKGNMKQLGTLLIKTKVMIKRIAQMKVADSNPGVKELKDLFLSWLRILAIRLNDQAAAHTFQQKTAEEGIPSWLIKRVHDQTFEKSTLGNEKDIPSFEHFVYSKSFGGGMYFTFAELQGLTSRGPFQPLAGLRKWLLSLASKLSNPGGGEVLQADYPDENTKYGKAILQKRIYLPPPKYEDVVFEKVSLSKPSNDIGLSAIDHLVDTITTLRAGMIPKSMTLDKRAAKKQPSASVLLTKVPDFEMQARIYYQKNKQISGYERDVTALIKPHAQAIGYGDRTELKYKDGFWSLKDSPELTKLRDILIAQTRFELDKPDFSRPTLMPAVANTVASIASDDATAAVQISIEPTFEEVVKLPEEVPPEKAGVLNRALCTEQSDLKHYDEKIVKLFKASKKKTSDSSIFVPIGAETVFSSMKVPEKQYKAFVNSPGISNLNTEALYAVGQLWPNVIHRQMIGVDLAAPQEAESSDDECHY